MKRLSSPHFGTQNPPMKATVQGVSRLILKTSFKATEVTEDTEMERLSNGLALHPKGERTLISNPLVSLCELCG